MTEANDPRLVRRAAMRRATMHLFLGVIVLDAIALGIYHFADLDHAAPRIKMYFTATWTVVTLMVVLTLLKRVRKIRYSR